jgi:hypothetical protein
MDERSDPFSMAPPGPPTPAADPLAGVEIVLHGQPPIRVPVPKEVPPSEGSGGTRELSDEPLRMELPGAPVLFVLETPERERARKRKERRQYKARVARWEPHAKRIRKDPEALRGFLAECLALEAQDPDRARTLCEGLQYAFPILHPADPRALVAALECVAVWAPEVSERCALAVDYAYYYAPACGRLFDAMIRHRLPWSVLQSLAPLPAFEPRYRRHGQYRQFAHPATLAHADPFEARIGAIRQAFRAAGQEIRRFEQWQLTVAEHIRTHPEPVDPRWYDHLPVDEQARLISQAEKSSRNDAKYEAERWYHYGDRLNDVEALATIKGHFHRTVDTFRWWEDWVARVLEGARPARLVGGVSTLHSLGDVAAALVYAIARTDPPPDGGLRPYRDEVLQPALEILAALYGVTWTPRALIARVQKRPKAKIIQPAPEESA